MNERFIVAIVHYDDNREGTSAGENGESKFMEGNNSYIITVVQGSCVGLWWT